MTQKILQRWLTTPFFWVILIGLIYGISHIPQLLALPVFADEAIYIRWAQLLRHDSIYLYFSMNDGKPPLYIWLIALFLELPQNPLWLARFSSVIIGLFQLAVTDRVVRQLGGKNRARLAASAITIVAPFWFFHHRMALMDSLLTLFLTVTLWGLLLLKNPQQTLKRSLLGVVLAGTGWGLALWTKTPAIFLAPFFLLVAMWEPFWIGLTKKKTHLMILSKPTVWIGAAGILGLAIFMILRLQPTFGSLFSRGGDFTFTVEQLINGNWRTSIDNLGRLMQWLSRYLRPELLSLSAVAIFISRNKRNHLLLWLGAFGFAAPLLIFGKTLHPRYFLPIALFLTPSAALMFEETFSFLPKVKKDDLPWMHLVFALLVGFFFLGSLRFMFFALFSPNQIPFVIADRVQYLTEWSSGHGIAQVRDALIVRAREGKRTTVITEGSFGTLPDGLLLEFDRLPEIEHLRIEGLAQYPVKFIPEWALEETKNHEVWLLVNEDRLEMSTDQLELLARYPRPYGAPELHLYRVKPR